MLTGQFPFTGNTNQQLMAQVMKEPPSIDWSKIPEPLAEIVKRCLEKDRNKRPTAAQVLDAVTRKISTPSKILQEFTFNTVTVDAKGQINHRETKQGLHFTEDLGQDITLEMVYIPKGSFTMGAPATEAESHDNERPQHQVTIKPFLLGKYLITQAQWEAVANLPKIQYDLNSDPSDFKGKNLPVEMVSWYHAVEFCARLSQKTGRSYRLPSEAEWEYACRAGTTTPFHFGDTVTPDLVNYDGNSSYGSAPQGIYREKTTVVGSFPPNSFGLYDMHGNVWEWCADPWHGNYEDAPTDGSVWDETCNDNRYHRIDLLVNTKNNNQVRLLRGGSWVNNPRYCRSAVRYDLEPDFDNYYYGFRVVCVAAWT